MSQRVARSRAVAPPARRRNNRPTRRLLRFTFRFFFFYYFLRAVRGGRRGPCRIGRNYLGPD